MHITGYQRWRELAFLHWPADPAAVEPLLPPGLAVDTFDGRAWLGIVALTMRDVRPRYVPALPGISHFLELNVRTYVRHGDGSGIWFFSLDAATLVAVAVARAWWSLPYHPAWMATRRDGDVIAYRSRRACGGARFAARYRVGAGLGPVDPGTFEHFAVERYRLYAHRGGRLYTGQVRHRPYPLHAAELLDLDESVLSAAGLPAADGQPHVLFSPGVEVGLGPRTRCRSAVHLDRQDRPDRVGSRAVGRPVARAHQQHEPRLP
ncbi:YqjF family protein [Pseudonocardia sp.]|uniref:YqjF family protein n=1 Tax=Pseudonocardia sp. TaxID=60912 RepID=UPI003D1012B8